MDNKGVGLVEIIIILAAAAVIATLIVRVV